MEGISLVDLRLSFLRELTDRLRCVVHAKKCLPSTSAQHWLCLPLCPTCTCRPHLHSRHPTHYFLLLLLCPRTSYESFGTEHSASVVLQRAFRGWRVRVHLDEYHYYAREVQRVYRGHLSRKRVRRALDARDLASRLAVAHFCATRIQSAFKGSYSRKYIHDFYARKAYVAEVVSRGEALRGELEAKFARELRAELERRDAAAKEAFLRATAGLHHLVSTAVTPGVYNPPWATRRADVPSAFGVELEVHLRQGVLRTLRTRGLHAPSMEATRAATAVATQGGSLAASIALMGHTAVTVVPAYASTASRATIQAASHYDAPLLAARAAARESKYANLDQRPLKAGTRGRLFEGPRPLGVHASVPFEEAWLAARNDRETEHVRKHSAWVTGGVPFVPGPVGKTRGLFEDTERAGAVTAAAVVASVGQQQAAPGAFVQSIRIGNTLLPAAKGALVATIEPVAANPLTTPLTATLSSSSGVNKSGSGAHISGGGGGGGGVAGSAVAAARAGRTWGSDRFTAMPGGLSTRGGLQPQPQTQQQQQMGAGPSTVLSALQSQRGNGVVTVARKRPLMKPLPQNLKVEVPGGIPAAVEKLSASYISRGPGGGGTKQ